MHLLHREPSYYSVQSNGLEGPDGGVDIVANYRTVEDACLRTIVQVKRVKSFTKTVAHAEIRKLARVATDFDAEKYLLITSAIPSAAAIAALRAGARELGLPEVEVWDRSVVTAHLLQNPDLISFFFGIQSPVDWTSRGTQAAAADRIVRLLNHGHRLIVFLGSDVDLAREFGSPGAATARFLSELRDLIRVGVVSSVVSAVTDLSGDLADVLPLASKMGAHERALWQPRPSRRPPRQAIELLTEVARQQNIAPTIIAIGLNNHEMNTLLARESLVGDLLVDTALWTINAPEGESSVALGQAESLMAQLSAMTAGWELVLATSQLDYTRAQTAKELVEGETVRPGVVFSGCWEKPYPPSLNESVSYFLNGGTTLTLADLPGAGKTTLAFYLAHKLAPQASYYLDATSLPGITDVQFSRLVAWLERRHANAVLIIDNVPTAAVAAFRSRLSNHGARGPVHLSIVTIQSTPFQDSEVFGGEFQDPSVEKPWWEARRAALGKWVLEVLPHLPSQNVERARSEARNPWHFFYLLRGGFDALDAELRRARGADYSDLVWFAIAAVGVFQRKPATFRALYAFFTSYGLWPLAVDGEDDHGRWLTRTLARLLTERQIVWTAAGFACRHRLEAMAIVRALHERDPQVTAATYSDVTTLLFCEALDPLRIPAVVSEPADDLTKSVIYDFVGTRVNPLLALQRELEQAVPYTEKLQAHVELVWAQLTALVEEWPPHTLYWLFNSAHFLTSFLRFSPFRGLKRFRAISEVKTTSDALDVAIAINGMVALDALKLAEMRWVVEYGLAERASLTARLVARAELSRSGDDRELAGDHERALNKSLELVHNETTAEADMLKSLAGGGDVAGAANATELRILRARTWLTHIPPHVERTLDSIPTKTVIAGLKTVHPYSRPLFIAHMWLMFPQRAVEVLTAMPSEWREQFRTRVREAVGNFTPFHLEHDSAVFGLFVHQVAEHDAELRAWLNTDSAEELGEAVRMIGARSPVPTQLGPEAVDRGAAETVDEVRAVVESAVGRNRLAELAEWEAVLLVEHITVAAQERLQEHIAAKISTEQREEVTRIVEQADMGALAAVIDRVAPDAGEVFWRELSQLCSNVCADWVAFSDPTAKGGADVAISEVRDEFWAHFLAGWRVKWEMRAATPRGPGATWMKRAF